MQYNFTVLNRLFNLGYVFLSKKQRGLLIGKLTLIKILSYIMISLLSILFIFLMLFFLINFLGIISLLFLFIGIKENSITIIIFSILWFIPSFFLWNEKFKK
jgi:hypothetical protein